MTNKYVKAIERAMNASNEVKARKIVQELDAMVLYLQRSIHIDNELQAVHETLTAMASCLSIPTIKNVKIAWAELNALDKKFLRSLKQRINILKKELDV